mgnify:CR=1 FL=1
MSPRAGSPIVGQWCFLYLEMLTSYREFTRDRVYTRLPVVTLRGRYSVTGDTLTVQMQNQPPGQYPFRIQDGLLIIRSPRGRVATPKAYALLKRTPNKDSTLFDDA